MSKQTETVAHGPAGETAEYVFVAPEMAVGWLALNIDRNRNMRKSRINGYVRDIQSDRWVVTGEAIKFDTEGRLIDGQNRCQAIVAAGKGAWALVARGISEEALVVLDSGSARNTGDMLVISVVASGNVHGRRAAQGYFAIRRTGNGRFRWDTRVPERVPVYPVG